MIVVLFAGAGGSCLGIEAACPDDLVVGIELDDAACRTRAAAGLTTIRANVAQLDTAPFIGHVTGVWGSPPCPQFSTGGLGAGNAMLHHLSDGITRLLHGDDCRSEIRRLVRADMSTIVELEWRKKGRACTDAEVWAEAGRRTDEACLVLEPARWAYALRPAWVACEQVPSVLPLWAAMARGLDELGYRTWAGRLDTADFGVAQNRVRAILMARDEPFTLPEPTHCDSRQGMSLFGLPDWITMADRLGWGMTERPALTVACGTGGGPHPAGVGGSGARRTLERERERERELGVIVQTRGDSGRSCDEFDATARPAPSVTTISGKSAWRRVRGA